MIARKRLCMPCGVDGSKLQCLVSAEITDSR
jgi:hypothetical protein